MALVTSGPGVTNAVTGIATAYMDSIPMVVITGQVPTHAIGQDAFQECDTVGITRPCVKHNFLVKDVKDLAVTIKKAFYIATTGRPGPVLVDIPKDVTQATTEFSYPKTVSLRSYNPVTKGHARADQEGGAAAARRQAPDDLRGRRRDPQQRRAAADAPRAPARLPVHQHADGPGRLSRAPIRSSSACSACTARTKANMAMQNCDVLLAVGARFDDRVIGNPAHFFRADRKIIHIDIDPSSISKRVKVDVPIVGDVADVLDEMLQASSSPRRSVPIPPALKAWWTQIKEWRARIA